MLREVTDGALVGQITFFGRRYRFVRGETPMTRSWGAARHHALLRAQRSAPQVLLVAQRRTYWMFEDRFWWEDEQLEAADVLALVRRRERRRRRTLRDAHAALALDREPGARRAAVAREVRLAVYERDGGACVACGSAFDLQYDHIIPVSRGGATSVANLQILCGDCNRAKSDAIA